MKPPNDQTTSFYFARHAETELNRRGLRCGGDVDIPLTESGCQQAFQLGGQIKKMNLDIDVILTSPLIRTRQTALLVSGILEGVSINDTPLLKERRLGGWNKQPITETETQLRNGETPPGGESEEEFRLRMLTALQWLQPYFDQRLLIVGSKGVGRVLYSLLGGQDRLQIANGELLRFEFSRSERDPQPVSIRRLLSK